MLTIGKRNLGEISMEMKVSLESQAWSSVAVVEAHKDYRVKVENL